MPVKRKPKRFYPSRDAIREIKFCEKMFPESKWIFSSDFDGKEMGTPKHITKDKFVCL